ncbi:MAG: redox-regulated ATPase YchF [Bacteroidales bacterium]|nr:redox-regulated ATPase YchF [Bacteroidales bacterium]
MSLKCGIVGLPNVGKSTLFNCVSSGKAQSANFPFCTIEPNVGSTNVPDKRLEVLADICQPKRTIPATVEIVDIAGLVKGASHGEGLGNQFLANIRECDAILHVLRCFDDGNIVHVDGSVDPVRDMGVVDTELQIKDLETVENRIKKVEKMATTGGDKEAKKLLSLLLRYKEVLLQGRSCREVVPENPEEEALARDLYLLTNKPVMYVCNVDEASAVSGNAYVDAVREAVAGSGEILVLAARSEAEIAEIEEYEDRQMFLEEMGLSESGVVRLIQGAYKLLGLRTFFTAGADECRAWTIIAGDKAPRAAGVIHTDFERGFIRAEVIKYDDFVSCAKSMSADELRGDAGAPGESALPPSGRLGVEGKDYVVQDGDIMHFLFNV